MSKNVDATRQRRIKSLRDKASGVDAAERDLTRAIEKRDRAMIEYHGDRREGGLSYKDIAEATGVSRTRAVQIVQGVSNYSKSWGSGDGS